MIDITTLVIILVSILISMTLHEAMHAFVSDWLGDDTARLQGRLTLNPIAHIDPFMTIIMPLLLALAGAPPFGAAKPVPFNPNRLRYDEFGAAIVGAAGPLTNLGLALISGGLLRLFGAEMDPVFVDILLLFTLVNLSFFVFNMIPFPPLDGSRVLYAFAPDMVRNIMERIEAMGIFAILFFFFIFYSFLSEPFGRLLQILLQAITGGVSGF